MKSNHRNYLYYLCILQNRKMRTFVTVILLLLFALICTATAYVNAVISATIEACTVESMEESANSVSIDEAFFIPRTPDRSVADMEVADAQSLAHRVSTSAERMYRFSSFKSAHFIKTLLRRMAVRMANLTNCYTRVYDTSRSFGRDNACGHYIFAMRRILI